MGGGGLQEVFVVSTGLLFLGTACILLSFFCIMFPALRCLLWFLALCLLLSALCFPNPVDVLCFFLFVFMFVGFGFSWVSFSVSVLPAFCVSGFGWFLRFAFCVLVSDYLICVFVFCRFLLCCVFSKTHPRK